MLAIPTNNDIIRLLTPAQLEVIKSVIEEQNSYFGELGHYVANARASTYDSELGKGIVVVLPSGLENPNTQLYIYVGPLEYLSGECDDSN